MTAPILTADVVAQALVAAVEVRRVRFSAAEAFEPVSGARGVRILAGAGLVARGWGTARACARVVGVSNNELAPTQLRKNRISAEDLERVVALIPSPGGTDPEPRGPTKTARPDRREAAVVAKPVVRAVPDPPPPPLRPTGFGPNFAGVVKALDLNAAGRCRITVRLASGLRIKLWHLVDPADPLRVGSPCDLVWDGEAWFAVSREPGREAA